MGWLTAAGPYSVQYIPMKSPDIALIAPDYWGGADIQQLTEAGGTDAPDSYYLGGRLAYTKACGMLLRGITEIMEGSHTEVRFEAGNELGADSSLPDGSLVIIESEAVQKYNYQEARPAWRAPFFTGDEQLSHPYIQHWLDNQDETTGLRRYLGGCRQTFRDAHIIYDRYVKWGVAMTHQDLRLIQPFSFGAARLEADGSIAMPPYYRTDAALIGAAVLLPTVVGEITAVRGLQVGNDGISIDRLQRIKAIDLVHASPRPPEDGKRARHRLPAGRVALRGLLPTRA